MSDPLRVALSGPLEPFAGGYAAELARRGYARDSVVLQLHLVAHLSRWLESERLAVGELRSAVVVERFFAVRRARYTHHVSPRALAPFLAYVRETGVVEAPFLAYVRETGVVEASDAARRSPAEALLERYRWHLVCERGLRAETARGYVERVRPFVAEHVTTDDSALGDLTAGDVSAFVLVACRGRAVRSAKLTVTALRSLLRFLHVEGVLAVSLVAAVPTVAGWRLAGLPRGLEPAAITALMASCDRSSPVGRRDRAVLMLLSRLALRAGELGRLQLDDVDWRAGEIVVRGKGDRHERLPLPADVGEALAAYLECPRPASADRRSVFTRVHAPQGPLTRGAVKQIVSRAALRAGVSGATPHALRHSAATDMLRAGAPLAEIAQVLRHRYVSTTAIYAKVDREALRSLARPWPPTGTQ